MAQVTTTTTMTVQITPELAAQAFWEMTADEQAIFFNNIAKLADVKGFNQQMIAVTVSKELTMEGQSVMGYIGRHLIL